LFRIIIVLAPRSRGDVLARCCCDVRAVRAALKQRRAAGDRRALFR
jgi:hypothetical protein